MRKKTLKYYHYSLILKATSLKYKLFNKKAKTVIDNNEDSASNIVLSVFNPAYSSYDHFKTKDEINHVFQFNKNDIAVNFEKMGGEIDLFFTAYYSLICYNDYIQNKDKNKLNTFLNHIEFIIENAAKTDSSIYFMFQENPSQFNVKPTWLSGIVQSVFTSCFLRAYIETNEEKYLSFAKKSINPMLATPLLIETPDGYPWIEEYPSNPPSYALNSFIFSVIAIGEYASIAKDDYYINKFKELLNSLFANLHKYTYGKYYRHNLLHMSLCNIDYQGLFVSQWYHLYKMTNHPYFLKQYETYNKTMNWSLFYEFYQIDRSL